MSMTLALHNFRAAELHRITLAGTDLCYRSFGEGPAVMFVHGWPLSGITYRHLIEALRPHYRCIVPDLPGTGSTPWAPQMSESMSGYAALLREFIDRLELDRLALIGHDSGGGVARLVAAELGSRTTCLILQNTEVPDHIPPMVRALKLVTRSQVASASFGRLLKSRRFRLSAFGFGECFGDRSLIEGEFFEACVKPLLTDMRGNMAMLAKLDLEWTRRLPEVHGRIGAPIHLFWGAKDKFFPLERARAMQREFGQRGELEVVPNAKLYVHEEAPDALARFSSRLLQAAFAPIATTQRARLQS